MVLTDREIESAIASGQISIDPSPAPEAFSSSSLDLTLAPHARVWDMPTAPGVSQIIDPNARAYSYQRVVRDHSMALEIGKSGWEFQPGEFLLAFTAEVVGLRPASRVAARVEGKSSLARLGLAVHVTAPTIDAGFEGSIQLELCNVGPLSVRLTPGMRICQLIFEQTLGTPNKGYRGQFFGQTQTPETSTG